MKLLFLYNLKKNIASKYIQMSDIFRKKCKIILLNTLAFIALGSNEILFFLKEHKVS
jgi:hypothetical protein